MQSTTDAEAPPLWKTSVNSESVGLGSSVNSERVGNGVIIPRQGKGESIGGPSLDSTTDSSPNLLSSRDRDPSNSNKSRRNPAETNNASCSAASPITTISAFGASDTGRRNTTTGTHASGRRRRIREKTGASFSELAPSQQGLGGGVSCVSGGGKRGKRYSMPTAIPSTATESRVEKDGTGKREMFGRTRGTTTEEAKAEARGRFWNRVRPARARASSMVLIPPGGSTPGLSMMTLRVAIKLKKKASIIQAKTAMNKYMMDPRSVRMQYWKNWMLVNIMYTVIMTPLRISFQFHAKTFGLILAGIVNASFIIDTILHFFLAVETESGLLTDRKEIARRYLTSWFFLDLLTCLPYTTLLRTVIPASMKVLSPLRGVRLLKLLKVVKVYAMHYEVSPVAMSIGKTLVTVILAAHLLSCFWFWVHCYDALQAGTPKEWTQCGLSTSVASQYLSSFYFIIYTMMTVGYGDQSADASSKKGLILSVCIQLTGATLFGFIIAATRRIVQFIAPIQKATTTNLQHISEYAVDRRLPDGVSSRIKRHFRYFYFKTSVFDERAVMEHIPWQLCQEVMSTTHGVAINAVGLMQDEELPASAIMSLARAMKPMELDSTEEAVLQGDVVLQAYFVIRGRIEAYVHEEAVRVGGDTDAPALRHSSFVGVWGPGSFWGLSNIMLGGFSEATFVAASPTDLLWLDQSELIAAMEENPCIRESLMRTAEEHQIVLRETLSSATISKEGLKLKQICLMDFKGSDLKQQLKHTDVRNLCMAASADQLAAASARQAGAGSGGGVVGMVQDFQQMASFSGWGFRGRMKSILVSLKRVLHGSRMHMRPKVEHALPDQTLFQGLSNIRNITRLDNTHDLSMGFCKEAPDLVQLFSVPDSEVSFPRLVRTWRGGRNYGYGRVYDGLGREIQGVMETEETPEELNRRWIMLPDQLIKLRWDVAISMVCVLVSVLTPYRMAFASNESVSWRLFDAAVDALFVIDILLRFRTAFIGNAANNVIVYITLPGMIAINYLQGWMLFDIASTIPCYLFASSDKVFRGLIVVKLLRIGRVPALAQQLHRLREQEAIANNGARRRSWLRGIHVEVPRWCLDVVQILVVILYASHIFGCLWWVTSRYDQDESWWERDGLDIDDAASTYIASLYWAATTITTVGYGDLVPTNDLERMVACVTMVCGTTMFSYVIGSVSTLVMNPTGGSVRRNLELRNVDNYLEEQKVGAHLGSSVRTHMMFVTGARSAWNEEHILSTLPPRIQERVLEHIHRDAVLVIPILKTRPPSFVAAILRNLLPRQFSQGEVVYKNLQTSQGVYFVTKGIAEAYVRVKNGKGAGEEERVKGIVSEGNFFGYTRFLAAFLEEDMAVKAFTQLYVYLLSNSCIQYLLRYHPFLAEELRTGLEEAIFQQASEEISSAKKKVATKRPQDGGGEHQSSGKPLPSKQPPGRRLSRWQQTSALASYLGREGTSVVPVGAEKEGNRPPKATDNGREREANDREEWGGREEEKLAANVAAQRVGGTTRERENTDPAEASASDSSDEDSVMPGLSGILVTQLTWGKGAWSNMLADETSEGGEPAAPKVAWGDRDQGPSVTATASAANAEGHADDVDRRKRTEDNFVLLSEHKEGHDPRSGEVRPGEGGVSDQKGPNGENRTVGFTEELIPGRNYSVTGRDAPRLAHEGDARHIPPATASPQHREKPREELGESGRENDREDGRYTPQR